MRPPTIPQPIPFHGNEPQHVKLLKTLYNTLVEYRDPQTGRILISIFMCLPSRKDFPEYFDVIKRPISMYEIQKRINNGMYQSVEPCLNDFRLMFDNCRTFNEDGSMIFQDAVRLEELLFDKYDQITPENGSSIRESPERSPLPPTPVAPVAPPPVPVPTSIPSTPTNNRVVSQKKRLLTGYIIYAAEVRKEYVDKHPNQEFGFISRLIGNDWKSLPKDLRQSYENRASLHNKKMREKQLRANPPPTTPHSTEKRRESALPSIRRRMEVNTDSPLTQQGNFGGTSGKSVSIDASTQTAPSRFVEPTLRRPRIDAENFKRYIESLGVSNMDAIDEELSCFDSPTEPVESWLGAGIGRHESAEAALWALRDIMLQNSESMRLNINPYEQDN